MADARFEPVLVLKPNEPRPAPTGFGRRLLASRFILGWLRFVATRSVPGRVTHDPSKPDLLLITHEAGRSGAPILAQNIAAHLSQSYNIVVLSLEDGELLEAFADASVAVHSIRAAMPRLLVPLAILGLAAFHQFRFALVNSMMTLRPTRSLVISGIPMVVLVHEFAMYDRLRDTIRKLFDASRLVVFSSNLTLEHSRKRLGFDASTRVEVIPQGKSAVPGTSDIPDETLAALRLSIRPKGRENAIVVLGAGSIQYRKGVDLFVSTAVAAAANASHVPWHFVWIGETLDANYTQYVKDQIERSGIDGTLTMLPPTAAIEAAYRMADVFVISSRLDPLPNVGLDAMSAGLPVLCFDRTTGLTELLQDAGLNNECVVPYLDHHALADRLISLATNPDRRAEIGRILADYARKNLRMDDYVARLDELIEKTLFTSEEN